LLSLVDHTLEYNFCRVNRRPTP